MYEVLYGLATCVSYSDEAKKAPQCPIQDLMWVGTPYGTQPKLDSDPENRGAVQ